MKGKRFLKSVLAAFCSFLCMNFICLFYYSAPGVVYRSNGATVAVQMPDTYFINASEGYGINHFDRRGYNNPNGELEGSYVLMMGSSHVEAIQVSQKQNMSTILNGLLGGTDTELRVYNIAHVGNFLPGIVKGFEAGIREFPDSSAVVIEVTRTSFYVSDLQKGMQQTVYDSTSDGIYLAQHLTAAQKLRSWLIGGLPFIKLMKNVQFADMDLKLERPFGLAYREMEQETEYDEKEYEEVLNDAFSLLRSEYDKPLIIVYHPQVVFKNDSMEIVRDEATYDIFQEACENNNIIFWDTGEAFLEAYNENYTVPYGFSNTQMGAGHLNKDGHRIIAYELYKVLQKAGEAAEK